jgi:transglutaminase-like putative cysteine protease
MNDMLPDALHRLYTDPADYIDSVHPSVVAFAHTAVEPPDSAREKASKIYTAVRDGIDCNPYVNPGVPESFRASSVLAADNGYCVGKAALYAAACRVHGIPARVGFADMRNHLTTEKLRQSMGTDMFTWHGFTEVFVDGDWRKATPTFNDTLCARLGVEPLDFDGHGDALLHPFDGAGRAYMQYLNNHGSYHDVPAKFLMREMARDYAGMQREDLSGRDMEREATEG